MVVYYCICHLDVPGSTSFRDLAPTVEDFLSLIEKLKLKTVPIKGGYIAIKTLKGKCITYLRPTKYGFSFESKNDKGNWVVERISQQSQLADKVKVIQQRLK